MRAIKAIAWKDFKTIVFSPTFFIIAFLCSAIWGSNFMRAVIQFAYQSSNPMQLGGGNLNLHYNLFVSLVSFVNIIFIFAIPAITMKLISEEKKQKSYDLLLTSPITSTDIAVGKFVAGFGVSLLLIGITLFYPMLLSFFAKFSWTVLLVAYAGLVLVTALYVALGLLASSITQSSVLSVILGIVFNLILWLMAQAAMSAKGSAAVEFFEYISVPNQLYAFLKGTMSVGGLVFFLSVIIFFVFLTQRMIEATRWR